jgi:PAS domain S-box-containing protein
MWHPMPSRTPKSVITDARKLCRSVMDAVNSVILIFDPKTFRILDANEQALNAYGYSRRQMVGKELRELTHEVPNYSDFMRSAGSMERTDFNKAGEPLQFLVGLSLIDYWGHKAVLSMQRDIGDRKAIEAAISASEKRLKTVLESISEIVVLIDAQGKIISISPQVERALGLTAQEVHGRDVFEFIHPDDRERARAEYSKTVREPGLNVPSVLRLRNQEGRWVPFEIIATNLLHDPDIAAVIFTARDLRFRQEAEQAVRDANADFDRRVEQRTMEMAKANAALRIENQQRRYTEMQLQNSLSLLNSTLESTADGILVISLDRLVSSCNKKFLEMWGFPKMAIVGLNDDALLAISAPQLQDPTKFQAEVQALYANPEDVGFDTLKLKDGRIFERYSQPQRIGDRIVGRVWSFRDVTQSRHLEEELRQAQKMEAVGRLAGGVAHDFNNLLMLISGYADQMLEDPDFPQKHREACQQLVEATNRAGALTRQLLAFSRKQPVAAKVVDLNRVVSDMQKMLQRLLSDRVKLVINFRDESLPVYADPGQLELVIMNLAINARDAMPDGGVLSLTTRKEMLAGSPEADGKDATTDFALLEVTDTGHGMPPEIREHIFEPFFTTKDIGKGTGLGLSTVYGIVEQAGGYVSVESEPNHGSTFRIYLPKSAEAAAEAAEAAELPVARGHETILLVEDEAGIRAMTKVYLESLGYKILEAGSAQEALRVAREHRGEIHLLITDVVMPGMRGDDLVSAFRKQRPAAAALFISGFADLHELDPSIPVVEKPFTFPDLGRRARAVLDDAQKTAHAEEKPRAKKRA